MKILFVWPNKDSFGFKPIGISLLSGIAKQLGWETKLFDTTEIDFGFVDDTGFREDAKIYKPVNRWAYGQVKKKLDITQKFPPVLKGYNPDCLAISVLSDEFPIASLITGMTRGIYRKLPIIWGGKHPTLNPELALRDADFACVGEGFGAFSDFLKALQQGSDLYSIPNIWARKDNSIIRNHIRRLEPNLDELPYVDWGIFDKSQFYKPFDGNMYRAGDHMLNWGCPRRCSYCINAFYHNMYDNKYFMRRYSIRRIIDELKYLKRTYNLEFMKFHDEDFLLRPLENLRELSEVYKQEVNIPFTAMVHPQSVTEERVKLLKNMNCASISIGIETGDPDLRKNLLKRTGTEADIINAFSLFREYGIRTTSFIMLGIPFETRGTYQKTVELTRKANPDCPDIGFFYPFEGTELRRVSIREGFFNPDNGITYHRDRPALHFDNLSEAELIEMLKAFPLRIRGS